MDAGREEQMLLHWNNFHSSMAAHLCELQQQEQLVDVTIVTGGGMVRAHQLLLSACSPFLKGLLEGSPCDHPVLILKDVGRTELLSLLEFMYSGEVRVTHDELEAFLQAAELLQVKGLTGGKGKTEEDLDNATTTTTLTKKDPLQIEHGADSENDREKGAKRRRVKRRAVKRMILEEDGLGSASKSSRTDTSSSIATDDDSSGANSKTEYLALPEQSVELVEVASGSDTEQVNATDDLMNQSNYHNDMSGRYPADLSDGLQLIQRQRGYPQLVHGNFIFNCQLYKGEHVYWVCQDNYKFNCRASVVTVRSRVINTFGAMHNHDSHEQEVEDEMLKGNFRVQQLRRDMFLEVHTGID